MVFVLSWNQWPYLNRDLLKKKASQQHLLVLPSAAGFRLRYFNKFDIDTSLNKFDIQNFLHVFIILPQSSFSELCDIHQGRFSTSIPSLMVLSTISCPLDTDFLSKET